MRLQEQKKFKSDRKINALGFRQGHYEKSHILDTNTHVKYKKIEFQLWA